jgi:Ca2+-binding RTX toxin-like protein
VIRGNAGNNTLVGGLGDDIITGGGGKDLVTGGGGLDRFVIEGMTDSGVSFAQRDVINTFAHGDKIDLRPLDARTDVAGDQAFAFIGAAAFSGVSGQLRFDMTNISPTGVKAYTVWGDVDGDRAADFSLQIYTAPTADRPGQPQGWNLFAWDFVL